MEKLALTPSLANRYVLAIYEEFCDLDEASIISYMTEDGSPRYELIDYIYHEGQKIKRITKIKTKGYLETLKHALEKKGYLVSYIEIKNKNEEIKYDVFYNVYDYQYSRRRKK